MKPHVLIIEDDQALLICKDYLEINDMTVTMNMMEKRIGSSFK